MSAIKQSITGTGNIVLGTYTLTVAANASVSGTNTGDQDLSGLCVKSNNLSDLTNAATARTNLGLGSMAEQAASNVSITGGSIANASFYNATVAYSALDYSNTFGGVAISNGFGADATNCQLIFVDSDSILAFYGDGEQTIIRTTGGATDVSLPTEGTLLSNYDIGFSVQAYDVDLTTWAGITPGANVGTFLATPSGANLASALTSALPESKGGTGITALGIGVVDLLGDHTTEDVCEFREDFVGGTNSDGQIGAMGWRYYNTAGSGSSAYITGEVNHPGIFRLTTGASSGNGNTITLAGSSTIPFSDPTTLGFTLRFIFRLGSTASIRYRAGMGNGLNAVATRFIGVRYDTTQADTNFMVVAYNADGTENQASSLGVAADTGWHNAEIQQVSTTSIRARMDSGAWVTISSEVPFSGLFLTPFVFVETQTAASKTCDTDFIGLSMKLSR